MTTKLDRTQMQWVLHVAEEGQDIMIRLSDEDWNEILGRTCPPEDIFDQAIADLKTTIATLGVRNRDEYSMAIHDMEKRLDHIEELKSNRTLNRHELPEVFTLTSKDGYFYLYDGTGNVPWTTPISDKTDHISELLKDLYGVTELVKL